MKYLFRNLHTASCRVWYPIFVQCQRHNQAAVFLNKGKYLFHGLHFAVYGVYHGLAVIPSKCRLHSLHIGSVDLKRQVGHGLNLAHSLFQHIFLVNIRYAHIHIKDMCSLLLLRNGLV